MWFCRHFGSTVCAVLLLVWASGCASHAIDRQVAMAAYADLPRELNKTSHPAYRVEPPDILLIQATTNIRPANDPLKAGDNVTIRLQQHLPFETEFDPDTNPDEYRMELERDLANKILNGNFMIGPDGTVNLGPAYGKVHLEGLTLDQARAALATFFQQIGINEPDFAIFLPDLSGEQPVVGEHLVRPDGTVQLGIYGQVYVAGMTLPQVKAAIENHLAPEMHNPRVSVDMLAFNSKVFYVIMDGGGYGEQVIRLPCTGNETVLDAISQVYGLAQVSSKKMWISRPSPSDYGCAQVLDVHWSTITREGITTTNYQLFPGDRIYVQADHLIATNNWVSKIISPLERIVGFTALTTGTAKALKFFYLNGQ